MSEEIELTGNGDRVTEALIQDRISAVEYSHVGTTVTVCTVTVNNGFCVIGTSACVDPTNFDEGIGRDLAFKDAFRQLWPLFGFLLAEKRFLGTVTTG